MSRILKAIKHPKRTGRFILVSLVQKMHFIFSDNFCIRLLYLIHFDKRLKLDNPTSFNEKLNWLKINDHNSSYSKLVDKYEVKSHVASLIGKEYIVNCYGVWNHFDDIDFTLLPDKFVIKTTHDSGGVYICRDKKSFDFKDVRKSINKRLKRNFYYISWEFPYKDVCPRIIVEQLLENGGGGNKTEIKDYKFWCFNGVPTYCYITNKGNEIFENFYDMEFNIVNINHGFPRYKPEYTKPFSFELMKVLAQKLSTGFPFIRIDFFEIDGKVYFGEYTFYDWGGEMPFSSMDTDLFLGSLIKLPIDKND